MDGRRWPRAEVAHETHRGGVPVDEQERCGDREQRDEQDGDAHGGADEHGPVLAGLYHSASEEEQTGHQERARVQGGEVRAAELLIDRTVGGICVECHRDGDGEGGLGEAPVGAFAAADEQARRAPT